MKKQLLIFDLDGTLVDSSEDLCNAINYAIEPLSVKPITIDDTKRLVGEGISKLIDKLIKEKGIEFSDKDILERFLSFYNNHLLDHTKPYPEVIETLNRLNNFKKAVVTNKRTDMSREILRGLSMEHFFELIVGSDTTGFKKPSAVPLLYVLDKLKISPEDAIIIGDSMYDIEAGKASNISTIAVSYGFRPADTLKDADFIIDNFSHILNILNINRDPSISISLFRSGAMC